MVTQSHPGPYRCFRRRQKSPVPDELDTDGVACEFSVHLKQYQLLVLNKGFAVKKGMAEAKGAYKLFMDADYAVSMDFFPSFLKQIQSGYDVVFASRTQKRIVGGH